MFSRARKWVLAAFWAVAVVVAWPAQASEDSHVLVLGRISDDPSAHYAQLKPLLDYVVPRMREVGITEGRILMARDAQLMSSYLRRGRVDWVTETASTAVQLEQRAGARPILLTERSGVSSYSTVFFVRKDSPIQTLEDLRGRTLALQSTASTSAYMVPLISLLDANLSPEILLGPADEPAPERVGYVLVRSERNIASWVHKGLADAGAVSILDWEDETRFPDAFKDDFRVIHQTAPYPRALELTRGDLRPEVRERLREVLLEAAGDPVAGEALARFFGTSRFLPLDRGTGQVLDALRVGVGRVRAEVE